MRAYSLPQMKSLLSLKPAHLLADEEKTAFRRVLKRRNREIERMKEAIRKNKPSDYYNGMKGIVFESDCLGSTSRNMKKRLEKAKISLNDKFKPFGGNKKKWPPPARAEDDKLKKGMEFADNFLKIEDGLLKYIKIRTADTYETCVNNPGTFELNGKYLDTVLSTIKSIHNDYGKLLDGLEEADRKARSAAAR